MPNDKLTDSSQQNPQAPGSAATAASGLTPPAAPEGQAPPSGAQTAADQAGAAPASAAAQTHLSELLCWASQADATETQQEQEQANRLWAGLTDWLKRQQALSAAVLDLRAGFKRGFELHQTHTQSLPAEALSRLASRQESIALCGRMLERLAERLAAEPAPEAPALPTLLPPLTEAELSVLLLGVAAETLEPRAKQLLKERRIQQQKTLAELRSQCEAAEKKFVNTVVRQVCPILDGLDEGKKISGSLGVELRGQFPDRAAELAAWFSIYDELIGATLSALVPLQIQPISAQRGEPMDYELYEPLDVEADAELADEQIKEVVRRGYLLLTTDGGSPRLLRAGQVVVVKNPSAE